MVLAELLTTKFCPNCWKAELALDRKTLADIAVKDPAAFSRIVEKAKASLAA